MLAGSTAKRRTCRCSWATLPLQLGPLAALPSTLEACLLQKAKLAAACMAPKVGAALRAANGHARQLAVDQLHFGARHGSAEGLEGVMPGGGRWGLGGMARGRERPGRRQLLGSYWPCQPTHEPNRRRQHCPCLPVCGRQGVGAHLHQRWHKQAGEVEAARRRACTCSDRPAAGGRGSMQVLRVSCTPWADANACTLAWVGGGLQP